MKELLIKLLDYVERKRIERKRMKCNHLNRTWNDSHCDYKNTEVALKCCDCKYCEPYSNPMCSKCFAKDKYVRAF